MPIEGILGSPSRFSCSGNEKSGLFWYASYLLKVGGATVALGGDPSFRKESRKRLQMANILENCEHINKQITRIEENFIQLWASNHPQQLKQRRLAIVNNLQWFGGLDVLRFFEVVGTSFKLQEVLSRDSIKTRMEQQNQEGINFAEFSYQVLQAYDFWHLHHTRGLTMQVGSNLFGLISI